MIIEIKQHKNGVHNFDSSHLGGKKYLKSPGGTYEWI